MKLKIVAALLIGTTCFANAQNISSKTFEVHMNNCVFHSPGVGSYIETYLSINPHSLSYKTQADSSIKGNLQPTIIFKKGNEIVSFDKYQLNTPAYKNKNELAATNLALIDLRRNALPNGNYSVEMRINNDAKSLTLIDSNCVVNFDSTKFSFSSVELVDTIYETQNSSVFKRGDLNLIPMVINYYSSSKQKLNFYSEIYPSATNKESKFILQYSIVKKETKKTLEGFSNSEVIDAAPIISVFETINIDKLPSGNYSLVLQVLNRNNEVYATTSVPFQRYNSLSKRMIAASDSSYFNNEVDINQVFVKRFSKDEMRVRLKSIFPIATLNEGRYIDNLITENNEEHMKRFYYNFWQKINQSNPVAAFNDYEEQLKIVNNSYGMAYKYGFETDRGRVYLQYGPPNSIQRSADGGNLGVPYEVWDYYDLGTQKNVQFTFTPRDRSSNDYEITATNKIGEKNNTWNANMGNNTQSSMMNAPDVNNNTWGNTLGRDLNNPNTNNNNSTNTNSSGSSLFNPK